MRPYKFKKNPGIVEKTIEELADDARLKEFFLENDVAAEAIEDALNELLTYREEYVHCEGCRGLSYCKQETTGMQPVLSYRKGRIFLEYHPCTYLRAESEERAAFSRVDALYMPAMVRRARLDDFYQRSAERRNLYSKIIALTNQYHKGERIKGLYLHGRYHVGKTYALAACGNRFGELGHEVVLAYYPDVVRELKSSIKTGDLEMRIERLKTVEILMLDDIGGESFSAWIRDEILGPVLQHRLLDERPTFFTSNVPPQGLKEYLTMQEKDTEIIKAHRIIERIMNLADVVKLTEAIEED